MVTLHLHVVATQANGSPCVGGKHIPGALVRWGGQIGGIPIIPGETRTGSNGVATIDITGIGCFNIGVSVMTPRGRIGNIEQTGCWWNPVQDVTWAVGVPGACDEGSTASDAGAWLGGFSGITSTVVLVGAAVLLGYVAYRIIRSPGARTKIVETGRGIVETGRGVAKGGRSAVRYAKEQYRKVKG